MAWFRADCVPASVAKTETLGLQHLSWLGYQATMCAQRTLLRVLRLASKAPQAYVRRERAVGPALGLRSAQGGSRGVRWPAMCLVRRRHPWILFTASIIVVVVVFVIVIVVIVSCAVRQRQQQRSRVSQATIPSACLTWRIHGDPHTAHPLTHLHGFASLPRRPQDRTGPLRGARRMEDARHKTCAKRSDGVSSLNKEQGGWASKARACPLCFSR